METSKTSNKSNYSYNPPILYLVVIPFRRRSVVIVFSSVYPPGIRFGTIKFDHALHPPGNTHTHIRVSYCARNNRSITSRRDPAEITRYSVSIIFISHTSSNLYLDVFISTIFFSKFSIKCG